MNKFMAGLTLGIVATTCFFIFYNPFQRKNIAPETVVQEIKTDSLQPTNNIITKDSGIVQNQVSTVSSSKVNRDSLVLFARSLLGVPYLYGSADPARGFDCSGFITYVFNHFNITVPRSSYEFEKIGRKVTMENCKAGDIILFTGTDPLERTVGHIGIICGFQDGKPSFVHSSSGKAQGVTITSMDNKFYQERFVSVVDLLTGM
ncbi:MAG: C40 family peptidase [Ferruginibacter sp.]